jgi:hypothetical protein
MQTLHRLRRFRDLRAVSSGAWPPADGAPYPAQGAPEWKGALRSFGKPQPILAIVPRMSGSMPTRLSAWLHVCPSAFRAVRRDGQQAA